MCDSSSLRFAAFLDDFPQEWLVGRLRGTLVWEWEPWVWDVAAEDWKVSLLGWPQQVLLLSATGGNCRPVFFAGGAPIGPQTETAVQRMEAGGAASIQRWWKVRQAQRMHGEARAAVPPPPSSCHWGKLSVTCITAVRPSPLPPSSIPPNTLDAALTSNFNMQSDRQGQWASAPVPLRRHGRATLMFPMDGSGPRILRHNAN